MSQAFKSASPSFQEVHQSYLNTLNRFVASLRAYNPDDAESFPFILHFVITHCAVDYNALAKKLNADPACMWHWRTGSKCPRYATRKAIVAELIKVLHRQALNAGRIPPEPSSFPRGSHAEIKA